MKPGTVVLSLEDPALAMTVEEVGTETLTIGRLAGPPGGVHLIHCVWMNEEGVLPKVERRWFREDRLILCRKTRFASGNTFATVIITSRGEVEPGNERPIVPMDQGMEELRLVRAERKRFVESFMAAHPGQVICYWYNWLADITVNLERRQAMATERGCPAIYDPTADQEFDESGFKRFAAWPRPKVEEAAT